MKMRIVKYLGNNMDYIAERKYPKVVSTLEIPRTHCVDCSFKALAKVIDDWLQKYGIAIYNKIEEHIKSLDLLGGRENNWKYTPVGVKFSIEIRAKEQLFCILRDINDDRSLILKEK